MVIATTLRAKDIDAAALRTLETQIYTLLGETSLAIKCTLKNNRLVVLAEHTADTPLDSAPVLDRLERNIQALQIQFTQKVHLYLRHLGERQPYAYRQFVLAPPPPPFSKHALSHSPLEQPWIVGDAELDALVNQLTTLDPLENWDVDPADGPLVSPMGAEDANPDRVQDDDSGLLDGGLIPNATELLLLDEPDLRPITSEASDAVLNPAPPSLASALVPADPPPSASVPTNPSLSALVPTDPPPAWSKDSEHRAGFHSFTYETSQRLKELSQLLWHPKSQGSLPVNRRSANRCSANRCSANRRSAAHCNGSTRKPWISSGGGHSGDRHLRGRVWTVWCYAALCARWLPCHC